MTKSEFLALLNPPPGPTAREFCVDVRCATGRLYLNVLGVTVAVEADLCRDSHLPQRTWDNDSLERAATQIRERLVFLLQHLDILNE
jgi:hypothetical protein